MATTCVPNSSADCTIALNDLATKLNSIRRPLTDLLVAIKKQALTANVVMSGYPKIFDTGACGVLTISEANRDRMRSLQDATNQIIREVATDTSTQFADPDPLFDGHRVCDSASWINTVGDAVVAGDRAAAYHPNQDGQAAMATDHRPCVTTRKGNMISQRRDATSARTRGRGRGRGRTMAASLGVLTLLAGAIGARGVGSPARATTLADLAQLRDRAVDILNLAQIKRTTGFTVGIEPTQQRIGVYLFTGTTAPSPDLAGLRASLGTGADLHTLTGTPHLYGRTWGGESIAMSAGGDCTTGFAIGLRDGRQGFLTAGHCFDTTQPANQQQAHTVDGQTMTGLEYNHGPSDWGIFTLDKTTDEAVGVIDTENGGHPVRAVVPPTLDLPICKTGRTTETTCGEITLLDATVVANPILDDNGTMISPATVFRGLIMTDLCSEDGDSGAPVYTDPAGVQEAPIDAVGTITGGFSQLDANDKLVCLEKLNGPGTSVSFAVPIATISATSTNPFSIKTG